MTLTEFLLARINEAETVARETIAARAAVEFTDPSANNSDHGIYVGADLPVPAVVVGPERVLAECEAKRRIVEGYQEMRRVASSLDYAGRAGEATTARNMYAGIKLTLDLLAEVYADHPDYDEKWRP